ncbi:MAG: hypothetical protein WDW38_007018 [Sanguina aurantia]
MSRSTILLAFAALLLISSPLLIRGQDEYGDEDLDAALDAGAGTDDVAVITVANWETVVASSKFALIEFYAPWCGHCKTLAPHYVKAAAALKKTAPHVVIGKVDATVEAALGTRFKVSGYPTLKWFVDGVEASDYNGGRDAEGLIKWVSKKTGPPALTVSEVDELEAMEDKSEVTVLGYFSAFEMILVGPADLFEPSSEVFSAFKVAAKKFKGQLVFVTVNNEATEAEPVIKFFDLKEAAGAAIVVGKSVDSIVFDKTKDVLLEVYAPWCGHCKKLTPIFQKLATRFSKIDSVVIAMMDGTENEHPLIEAKGYPSLIFFPAGEDTTPVVFDGKERSLAALTKFIKKSATIDYELAKKEADAAAPPPSGKDEL